MHSTPIDTVDAKQLELIFTIQGDEIVMDQTFLWNLVLVADPVEFQAGAEVILTTLERLNVFCVIFLQQN